MRNQCDGMPRDAQRRTLLQGLAGFGMLSVCNSFVASDAAPQSSKQSPLQAALQALRANARFAGVLAQPAQFRLQIALSWRAHGAWHSDVYRPDAEWTAPASMVKLPLAGLVLREVAQRKFSLATELRLVNPPACAAQLDELTQFESIARSLERMLIVSDNGAYNRLLEFVGMHRVNALLNAHGFPNALLQARLGACSPKDNSSGASYVLRDAAGKETSYRASKAHPPRAPRHGLASDIGEAHYDFANQLIKRPRSFALSNHFSLRESHRLLCNLADPRAFPEPLLDALSQEHRSYLLRVLRTLPRQANPPYDEREFPDRFAKFLLWGDSDARLPSETLIANKIGEAYGFLSDSAWISSQVGAGSAIRQKNMVLSATLYVNADGVLNDDRYEYDTIGYPFLAELGRRVLAHVPPEASAVKS
jgi:hypothetical protein